jgi:hypothetical protein
MKARSGASSLFLLFATLVLADKSHMKFWTFSANTNEQTHVTCKCPALWSIWHFGGDHLERSKQEVLDFVCKRIAQFYFVSPKKLLFLLCKMLYLCAFVSTVLDDFETSFKVIHHC